MHISIKKNTENGCLLDLEYMSHQVSKCILNNCAQPTVISLSSQSWFGCLGTVRDLRFFQVYIEDNDQADQENMPIWF